MSLGEEVPVMLEKLYGVDAGSRIQDLIENLYSSNYVLSISHSDYRVSLGGTEKVLHEEQAEFKIRDISYIQVHPILRQENTADAEDSDQAVGVNVDSNPIGTFSIIQFGLMLQMLTVSRCLNAVAVHIHHTMNFLLPGLRYLVWSTDCSKIRFFVHDYYTLCKDFNLLRGGRDYCGDHITDSECSAECKFQQNRGSHHREMQAFFLDLDPEIIAPSKTASDIWSKCFGAHRSNIRVVPHQIVTPRPGDDDSGLNRLLAPGYRPRIAYLGYESVNKGLETWWRLADKEVILKNYRLFHLGASGAEIPGVTYIPVSFLRDGPNAMIDALRTHQIDIAFLWSIWPETYSFTLFEALAANCYVITNNLSGNVSAQIKKGNQGIVFDDEEQMFDFLNDFSAVKSAVGNGAKLNSLCYLKFNPLLAMETAKDISIGMHTSKGETGQTLYQSPLLSSWRYLVEKSEGKCSSGTGSTEMLSKIDDLNAKLAVYNMSRVHRIVEAVRLWSDRFPFWKKVIRNLFFNRLWCNR